MPVLDTTRSLLLVIDLQEKFKPVITNAETVIKATQQLIKGCRLLDVPIVVTEQYPKGLGRTLPELTAILPENATVLEKTSFGCCGDDAFMTHLKSLGKTQILVCGIEAHICVAQTVLGLLDSGYDVHLAEEAIGSRHPHNKDIALRRLTQQGATPSGVEMALFELMQDATHPQFKAVQQVIL